jgi:hypothetical protein
MRGRGQPGPVMIWEEKVIGMRWTVEIGGGVGKCIVYIQGCREHIIVYNPSAMATGMVVALACGWKTISRRRSCWEFELRSQNNHPRKVISCGNEFAFTCGRKLYVNWINDGARHTSAREPSDVHNVEHILEMY